MMEDQGKRLLLAVAIAFALLWVWQIVFPTKPEEKKPNTDEQAATQAEQPDDSTGGTGTASTGDGDRNGTGDGTGSGSAADPVVAEIPRGEEELVRFEFDEFAAVFSSYGGSLKSWTLTGEQFEDRRVSPSVPLELVPTGKKDSRFYTMQVSLGEGPLDVMRLAEWKVTEKTEDRVTFEWENDDYKMLKKYRIDAEYFLVDLQVDVVPKTKIESKHTVTTTLHGFQDPKESVGGGMTRLPREWKAACLVGDSLKTESSKSLVKKMNRRDGDIRWGGFAHSYFIVASALENDDGSRLECDRFAIPDYVGGMKVELRFPPITVTGSPYAKRVISYFGPKFVGTLEQASGHAGFAAGFEESVDLGWLGFISGPLLWLLTIFQGFVINWGLAIVCLTMLIKLVLLPMTHKSIKSMKGMSKLGPQLKKLKAKHADDKQKLQVETMALFKTHGVNPAAGCLPMLLQMPIWFALYRMLMAAAELYQAPFIPGWIDDLTAPDPFYILPVSVMILMFFQTRLTPTTATGMQAKVLMYGMPLMFGFFSLFFPAGLTLYIFTNTSLTLVHYYFVHKEDRVKNKVEKQRKKERVAAGLPEEEEEEEEEDDSSDDSSDSDEKSKGSSNKSSNTGSNGQKKTRKSGKGSRGGKKGSKKRKKKKGPGAL